MNRKLFLAACFLIFFIWLVNVMANRFYWYSAMWWFDIPMHILGGIFLGLFFGALCFKRIVGLSQKEVLILLLLFVFVGGLGWEVFEYAVQTLIKGTALANIPDSIKDMLMDLIGGCIASLFVLRALKRYNKAHG